VLHIHMLAPHLPPEQIQLFVPSYTAVRCTSSHTNLPSSDREIEWLCATALSKSAAGEYRRSTTCTTVSGRLNPSNLSLRPGFAACKARRKTPSDSSYVINL
jgi:hypothetical protein